MELQINPGNRDIVMEELAGARTAGMVWTAFNNIPDSGIGRYTLHFFPTQAGAEDFCDQRNTAFINPYEENNGWENYRYVPVSQMLLYVMGIPEIYRELDLSVPELAAKMTNQQLHLVPGKKQENLLATFENGLISPIVWKGQVDPLQIITEYYIIQHLHAGHQVNEIGHIHRVAGSYKSYQAAYAAMDSLLARSFLEKDNTGYLLAGRYRGQKLEMDMKGCPSPHTGILLEKAYWQYDTELRAKTCQRQEINKLTEPVEIQKYFFAGFDRVSQSIRVLDGRC